MTDSKLRALERRWKETGSVEDEAAYLLERVRVGDLEQEKLELAAYFSDDVARRALGPGAAEAPLAQSWPEWPAGLRQFPRALQQGLLAEVLSIVARELPEPAHAALAAEASQLLSVLPPNASALEEFQRRISKALPTGASDEARLLRQHLWSCCQFALGRSSNRGEREMTVVLYPLVGRFAVDLPDLGVEAFRVAQERVAGLCRRAARELRSLEIVGR